LETSSRTVAHVGADREFQRHRGLPGAGPAGHPLEPLEPAEGVFLRVDDLALDLGRGGAGPDGLDHDDGLAHVRGQLHRDAGQGESAEQAPP
jgi:hypothetical protein